jgi:outer membrane receptor protein involved in Fe transport
LTAANAPFPSLRCIANALLRDAPGEKCDGLLNCAGTSQHTAGAAAQATRLASLGRSKHQLTVGAAVGVFVTRNDQDILFVASPQTGFGYFKNFGETRRLGVELGVSGHVGRVRAGGGYTWMAATYQSAETVNGAGNSTNDLAVAGAKGLDGTIAIAPGDRMPLIPRHTFKLFADIELTPRLSLDLDLVAISGSFASGNENNQHQPDGLYYLGSGAIPGYGVLNLGGHLRVTR